MISLIENAELYAPTPRGRASLLLLGGRIAKIGDVDRRALDALQVEYEAIDGSRAIVCPGFIDPHEHILGGSGEQGFASATPEIFVEELVRYGFTTVVGCLGVDITGKNMPGLIAKAKGLREEGIDALVWTGGYRIPPATLTGMVRDDILFVNEIIGAGEIAISDKRAMDPSAHELAKLAHDAYVGGMLSNKCGRTHFHLGDGARRLAPVRELIDLYEVEPDWIYVTHVERNDALMREAIALSNRGVFVDMDVVAEDLTTWLPFYLRNDGDPKQVTISSDASISSPRTLYEQMRALIGQGALPLHRVLPLVTANTARALKLESRGTLDVGKDADVVLLDAKSLDVTDVHTRGGGWLVRGGELKQRSRWLEGNKRELHLAGTGSPGGLS